MTKRLILSDKPIAESDEDKKGVIIDYSANDEVVGIEIPDASKISPSFYRCLSKGTAWRFLKLKMLVLIRCCDFWASEVLPARVTPGRSHLAGHTVGMEHG